MWGLSELRPETYLKPSYREPDRRATEASGDHRQGPLNNPQRFSDGCPKQSVERDGTADARGPTGQVLSRPNRPSSIYKMVRISNLKAFIHFYGSVAPRRLGRFWAPWTSNETDLKANQKI